MARPVGVGVVGCGMIGGVYLANAAHFAAYEVVHRADVLPERARARADE